MKTPIERLYNGIVKENPTFILMLGMCPTLAVTTSAINGLGMGLATTVVLVMSNMIISLLRKVIPDGVRMPAYIVIVAFCSAENNTVYNDKRNIKAQSVIKRCNISL